MNLLVSDGDRRFWAVRWATIKGESEPPAPAAAPKAPKKKRKLSAAGRAAIIAATKKMWAAKKAAAKKAKEVPPKIAAPVKKAAPAWNRRLPVVAFPFQVLIARSDRRTHKCPPWTPKFRWKYLPPASRPIHQ